MFLHSQLAIHAFREAERTYGQRGVRRLYLGTSKRDRRIVNLRYTLSSVQNNCFLGKLTAIIIVMPHMRRHMPTHPHLHTPLTELYQLNFKPIQLKRPRIGRVISATVDDYPCQLLSFSSARMTYEYSSRTKIACLVRSHPIDQV